MIPKGRARWPTVPGGLEAERPAQEFRRFPHIPGIDRIMYDIFRRVAGVTDPGDSENCLL